MAAWVRYGHFCIGLVIGLAMLLNLFYRPGGSAHSTADAAPRPRSGPEPNIILTTVTDMMGSMAFLSLTVICQQFLL